MPTGLPSWRHLDLNLRSCGLRGHATYAPDEPALAARLRAETALGEAWRCCAAGRLSPGSPRDGSGGRGAACGAGRSRTLVLRLLAVEGDPRASSSCSPGDPGASTDRDRPATGLRQLPAAAHSGLPRLGIDHTPARSISSVPPSRRTTPGPRRRGGPRVWRAPACRVDGSVAHASLGRVCRSGGDHRVHPVGDL